MKLDRTVRDFINANVETKYRNKFIELMIQWDGSLDVMNACYDLDVLYQQYETAKELTNE